MPGTLRKDGAAARSPQAAALLAARAVRCSATSSETAAARAGVAPRRLRETMAELSRRGACADAAFMLATSTHQGMRLLGLSHPAAPPTAASLTPVWGVGEILAARGAASRSHRRLPAGSDNVAWTQDRVLLWGERSAVASRADCPGWLLERCADDEDALVRQWAALNPNLGSRYLIRLAADEHVRGASDQIRALVAAHQRCPRWLLAKLAADRDGAVRAAVAARADTPPVLVRALRANPASDEVRAALASRGDIAAAQLEDYARSALPEVRSAAAAHPFAGAQIQQILVGDDDPGVRAALARRQDCNSETLECLARDGCWRVRLAVAAHPATGSATLDKMIADDDLHVRAAVAANSACSDGTLRVLSTDPYHDVRAAVAANPLCPLDEGERLAGDSAWEVRVGAASNPRTPTATVAALADDKKWRVAAAAAQTMRTRR